MGKSKSPPPAVEQTDKQKQLEALQSEAEAHRTSARELRDKKAELESNLRELDLKLRVEVDEILKNLPQSDTTSLVAELSKFKQSGRAELVDQIKVLEITIQSENSKAAQIESQAREVEKLVLQDQFDKAAKEIHAEFSDFVERFKVLNGKRFRLFEMAHTAGFRDFAERFKRLGLKFPYSYGIFFEGHLAKRNSDTMNVYQIAEQLEGLGRAYGEKPLALPGQPGGSENIPSIRDRVHGYGGFVVRN